jgi:hypothetical protein
MADEQKASAYNIMAIIPDFGYRMAKRHFGYQADERLKPKCPLKGHFAHPPSRYRKLWAKYKLIKSLQSSYG